MIVIAYGGGTNSTAMLVGMHERGIRPDLIIFADTQGEKPHTYKHIEIVSKWCASVGFPRIETVKRNIKTSEGKKHIPLYDLCMSRNELPSIAYGFKTCSMKFKKEPIDVRCNNDLRCKAYWQNGEKVQRWIGIDADESHRANGAPKRDTKKWEYKYPLLDWDWGRDECIEAIKRAGLPLPGKSACFFCPSTKKQEIMQLSENYPELAEKALAMEANAELTSIKGLGRNFAWKDVLEQGDMFGGFGADWEMPCDCFDGD